MLFLCACVCVFALLASQNNRGRWFHGFISLTQANALLMDQPPGTFLLRFSSNPGCYALALKHQDDGPVDKRVIHWRIEKAPESSGKTFAIFARLYDNITEIVETHRLEPLTLKNGQKVTLLKQPCP